MTTSDEISIIANRLANAGKTPSVALIKSQLNQTIPLPQIIAVLKNWQHDPKFIQAKDQKVSSIKHSPLTPDNQEISALIAEAIAPLQKEVSELKQLLQKLLDNQLENK